MDTPTAISTLTALLTGIQSQITGFQAQADALNIAISQLQGTLDTEQADIAEAVTAAESAQNANTSMPSQTSSPAQS
jgi:hypothetical protein